MSQLLARGYRFDGVNDEAELPVAALLSPLTMEMVVATRGLPSSSSVIVLRDHTEAGGAGWIPAFDTAGVVSYRAGGVTVATTVPTAELTSGRDRWVALVADAGATRWYLDGVLRHTGAAAGAVALASPLHAMRNGSFSPQSHLDGNARDVRLWSRALTAAELAPFRPTLTGYEQGLAGWWPLEGDTLDRVVRPLAAPITPVFQNGALIGQQVGGGSTALWAGNAAHTVSGGQIVAMPTGQGVPSAALFPVAFDDFEAEAVVEMRQANDAVGILLKGNAATNDAIAVGMWGTAQMLAWQVVGGVYSAQLTNSGGAVNSVGVHTLRARYENGRVTFYIDGVLRVDAPATTWVGSTYRAPAARSVGLLRLNGVGTDPAPLVRSLRVTPLPPTGLHGTAKNGARPAIARAVA
jgi:hypothetical protein